MGTITVGDAWGWIAAAFGAFLLICNVWDRVAAIKAKAQEPNQTQDERIQHLEEHKKHTDGCLARDNDAIKKLSEGNRCTQRALLALLDHALDGNNVKQMETAKQELISNLINK